MRRGRRKTEKSATASRILAAAEQHFAAQGMAGARTEEIAAAAHANKAMLYYYFGNKNRLHRAVLENLFRQLSKSISVPVTKGQPAKQRLRTIVTGYFDFLANHPNYPRLLQRQAMEGSQNFDWIARMYLRPFHGRLVRAVEEGVAAGEIRPVDPNHAAFTIVGMMTSYFAAAPILSKVVGHDLLAADAVAARKEHLLDFLEHGLATVRLSKDRLNKGNRRGKRPRENDFRGNRVNGKGVKSR